MIKDVEKVVERLDRLGKANKLDFGYYYQIAKAELGYACRRTSQTIQVYQLTWQEKYELRKRVELMKQEFKKQEYVFSDADYYDRAVARYRREGKFSYAFSQSEEYKRGDRYAFENKLPRPWR